MQKDKKNGETKNLKDSWQDEPKKESNDLLKFFIGVILLGLGLFLFSQQVMVSSSWYSWGFLSFGGINFTNGLIIVPLIIGIVMIFYNPKSIIAKVLIVLGVIFIIATIIMSVNFSFRPTSLYVYILIIGMIAAGSGLVLRVLFKNKK